MRYILRFFSGVISLFSILIKVAAKTGTITKATKRDAVSTTISVIGRYFMNSPIIPSQNTRGRNAAKVVAVDEITGYAISPVPSRAAS